MRHVNMSKNVMRGPVSRPPRTDSGPPRPRFEVAGTGFGPPRAKILVRTTSFQRVSSVNEEIFRRVWALLKKSSKKIASRYRKIPQ